MGQIAHTTRTASICLSICLISEPTCSLLAQPDTGQSTLSPGVWEFRIPCAVFRWILNSLIDAQGSSHSPTMHFISSFSTIIMLSLMLWTLKRVEVDSWALGAFRLGYEIFRVDASGLEAMSAMSKARVDFFVMIVCGGWRSGTADAWPISVSAKANAKDIMPPTEEPSDKCGMVKLLVGSNGQASPWSFCYSTSMRPQRYDK